MSNQISSLHSIWYGPYSWPQFEMKSNLPPLPKHPGIYLWTVKYLNGYLIYAAGITRRLIPTRFREHTRKYIAGDYNVLNISSMQQGVRKEVWHGWGWSLEKRAAFAEQRLAILHAVEEQLSGFCIFVANIGTAPRLLERFEAAIMNHLYQEASPFCDIPDKGMMLAPRWKDEPPIIVENSCKSILHRLPLQLTI